MMSGAADARIPQFHEDQQVSLRIRTASFLRMLRSSSRIARLDPNASARGFSVHGTIRASHRRLLNPALFFICTVRL